MQIVLPEELNTYDVLLNDWLVFSQASLDATVARLGRRRRRQLTPTKQADDADGDDAEVSA